MWASILISVLTAMRVLFQHIMTGQRPFSEYDDRLAFIILEVGVRDKRPVHPVGDTDVTDDLWRIIESCWATHPAMRPPIRDVVLDLTRLCATERPLRLLSIGAYVPIMFGIGLCIRISLDGGGVSAIASLYTLEALMSQIGSYAKPCDYFDMIAGSEVGGKS
jgi:hypothetical protein